MKTKKMKGNLKKSKKKMRIRIRTSMCLLEGKEQKINWSI